MNRKTTRLTIPLGILFCCAAFASQGQAADFYVDPDYAGGTRNGTTANPWQSLADTATNNPWSAINGALASGAVTVYFSAREAESDTNEISYVGIAISRTDSSSNRLILDGMSRYNTSDSNPGWAAYGGSSKFEVQADYPINSYTIQIDNNYVNQNYITLRGFKAVAGTGGVGGQALAYWGGNHVVIENNELTHHPAAQHGATLQWGYAYPEGYPSRLGNGGNTDITIRNNLIHDTFGECIYIGGSANNGLPAHSNVIIENNTTFHCGIRGGEGNCIDVKDELTKVTIRNNFCHDNYPAGANADGIVAMSQVNIENNVVYNAQNNGISLGTYWGMGFAGSRIAGNIIFNSAGDGIYFSADPGKPVSDTTISGNTVYQNAGNGLTVGSNGDNITGLTVKNNLSVANIQQGIGGWGQSTYTIFNNDFYGNNPDYGSPFSADPAIAAQNISINPRFANTGNPPGPDALFFTLDDGFVPQESRVCRGGEGGTLLGALPCSTTPADATPPASPKRLRVN